MEDNTSGFYKLDGEVLLFGPNFVESKAYRLTRETKDAHEYPVDGWRWMESLEEARAFYGIQDPPEEGQ